MTLPFELDFVEMIVEYQSAQRTRLQNNKDIIKQTENVEAATKP